jgi:hypothetical protein
MNTENKKRFSDLVCGALPVQAAFDGQRGFCLWWRVVLMLHGKPRDTNLPEADRLNCIANGFRFYAWLYRMLAVIFLSLTLALGALKISLAESGTWYWCVTSLLVAIYLWLVSGLGYAGARSYRRGEGGSISALIGFMVMVIAFLSLFLSAASVAAYHSHWLPTGPNLAIVSLVFAFGVGSYFIEIFYLATEGNLFVSRHELPSHQPAGL